MKQYQMVHVIGISEETVEEIMVDNCRKLMTDTELERSSSENTKHKKHREQT